MNNNLANVGVNLSSQFRNIERNDIYTPAVYTHIPDNNDAVFTSNDILRVVKMIDVHKGSGIDDLPTFILKDCFEVIIGQLTYMLEYMS